MKKTNAAIKKSLEQMAKSQKKMKKKMAKLFKQQNLEILNGQSTLSSHMDDYLSIPEQVQKSMEETVFKISSEQAKLKEELAEPAKALSTKLLEMKIFIYRLHFSHSYYNFQLEGMHKVLKEHLPKAIKPISSVTPSSTVDDDKKGENVQAGDIGADWGAYEAAYEAEKAKFEDCMRMGEDSQAQGEQGEMIQEITKIEEIVEDETDQPTQE